MANRKGRTATCVRFPPELHRELVEAAEERDVSVNWLVVKAVEDFLPRLLPPDEIRLTRAARLPPRRLDDDLA